MTEIRERLEQLAEDDAIEVVQDETTPTEEVEVVAEEAVVVVDG
jgi:TusA-related sulfurtransferase